MKKTLSLALLLALLGGVISPAAQAAAPELSIEWLTTPGEPRSYNSELNWLTLFDPEGPPFFSCIDLATGQPVAYDLVEPTSEGLAVVGRCDQDGVLKYGAVDAAGQEVIPLEYGCMGPFSEGLAAVGRCDQDGVLKYGAVDTAGQEIVPLEYGWIGPFSEGLAAVEKRINEDGDQSWRYGFVDATGREAIPLEYAGGRSFSEGFAVVEKYDEDENLKFGFVNAAGQEAIPLEYGNARDFSEGLAVVGKRDEDEDGDWIWRFGFLDATGREVVPLEYDDVRAPQGGHLRAVQKDGTWGVFLAPAREDGKPWQTVWLAVAAIGAAFVATAARSLCLTRKSRRPAPQQAEAPAPQPEPKETGPTQP